MYLCGILPSLSCFRVLIYRTVKAPMFFALSATTLCHARTFIPGDVKFKKENRRTLCNNNLRLLLRRYKAFRTIATVSRGGYDTKPRIR